MEIKWSKSKERETQRLIDELIMDALLGCHDPHKPGVVIEKFSHDKRNKLKHLKSEDFNRRVK